MKLHLLGTSGYHPSDTRQTACLMLPELGIVLDAGTGMYRVRDHLITDELDIFVSHSHLDHVIGLTYLFDVLWNKKMKYVHVHGEAEKLNAIEEYMFASPVFPVKPPFDCHPIEGEIALKEEGRLTAFSLEHPGGALGFRLDWPGHSMAYVTDTVARPEAAYLEAIRGVDLLVHECHFKDHMTDQAELTGHSTTTPVAEIAKSADVGKLVIVHINPLANPDDPIDIKKARAIFPKTEIGVDNMVVEF